MWKLKLEPYPWGKRFAVALVDDTDRATEPEVALAYAVLKDHGLSATKTVWPLEATATSGGYRELSRAGETLQQPGYRRLCRRLHQEGFELAMHTASAGDSKREQTLAAYALFEDVFGQPPATNIMHGRNRENIYWGKNALPKGLLAWLVGRAEPAVFCGHDPTSSYYWGDICREKTRYVRQFETLRANTLRFDPATPYHDPAKPDVRFWFSATYGSGARLFALFTPARLEALAAERGASILHTYFCRYALPGAGGRFAPDPRFVELCQRLAARQDAWVVPVATLLDRLRALRALRIDRQGGALTLTNGGDQTINDLALTSPRRGLLRRDGREAPLTVSSLGQLALGPLAPGECVRLVGDGLPPSCRPVATPAPRLTRLGLGTLARVVWQFGHGRRRLVSNSDPARARRFAQMS